MSPEPSELLASKQAGRLAAESCAAPAGRLQWRDLQSRPAQKVICVCVCVDERLIGSTSGAPQVKSNRSENDYLGAALVRHLRLCRRRRRAGSRKEPPSPAPYPAPGSSRRPVTNSINTNELLNAPEQTSSAVLLPLRSVLLENPSQTLSSELRAALIMLAERSQLARDKAAAAPPLQGAGGRAGGRGKNCSISAYQSWISSSIRINIS